MNFKHHCLNPFLLALCLLPFVYAAKSMADQSDCRRVNFSRPLSWVTSGVWAEDGEILLIADSMSEHILSFSEDGILLGGQKEFASISSGEVIRYGLPWILQRGPTGKYYLEDEAADVIVQLDHALFSEDQTRVKNTTQLDGAPARLIAVYGWQPMNKGFLAFGDIEFEDIRGPGRYKSAFLHFDESGILQVFGRPMDTLSEVRNHYLRNMPYIATLDGEVGYILNMEEVPSIRRIQIGVNGFEELESFPEDFRTCPRLIRDPSLTRALKSPEQETYFYEKIEASSMAAGLYAWDGHLYLAAKEAITKEDETAWWMIELDPQSGKARSRARLPTTAARLTLITGDRLAVIEKQPVEGVGELHAPYMRTSSMVLMPTSWIADPRSGPLSTGSAIDCGLSSD